MSGRKVLWVVAGFIPSTLGKVAHYAPALPEIMISVAVRAIGALIVTGLYRIALATRGEFKAPSDL